MGEGKKYLYWFLFILVLIVLGAIFKILPIIGLGIAIIGLIIFLYGANNNNEEDAIWGAIILVIGLVIFFSGIIIYNFLENIGVIDFLKLIFNKQ
ncbi:MAG: hypothetical protein WC438_03435 [Candidatus Pacearchaeota archaeon]